MNSPDEIRNALRSKTIAVVGASRDPTKDANTVPAYLKAQGYEVIPINPFASEVIGEPAYKSLLDLPEEKAKRVEVIDIFRPSQDIPPVVADAVQLKKKYGHLQTIWMQLGISNPQAAEEAKKAGLHVIQDACIRVEHGRLASPGKKRYR